MGKTQRVFIAGPHQQVFEIKWKKVNIWDWFQVSDIQKVKAVIPSVIRMVTNWGSKVPPLPKWKYVILQPTRPKSPKEIHVTVLLYWRMIISTIQLTLKVPNFPSLLRVPSGKKKTDAPFFTRSMHLLRQSWCHRTNNGSVPKWQDLDQIYWKQKRKTIIQL